LADILAQSWYMKYAPKTIDDYIFEDDEFKNRITEWCAQGSIPGNILLHGKAGVGKTVLCEILIRSIIKSQHDLNRIRSRSVAEIDELHPWLQKHPVKSKQKIVYFEEFDKISKVAQTTLKDGLLEKFQSNSSFIVTTNSINRIDPALVSRFNFRIEIKGGNVKGIEGRLATILKSEGVEFDEVMLCQFVEANHKAGMRNMITLLQSHSMNGSVDFSRIGVGIDSYEEKITKLTIAIFQKMFSTHDPMARKLALIQPLNNSIVAQEYAELSEILQYTRNIDWTMIFEDIAETVKFVPIQMMCMKYMDSIEHKKMPYLCYLAFIYESEKALVEVQ